MNSTAVNQSHDNIRVDIQNYARDVVPTVISPGRRKQLHNLLTSVEVRKVRALASKWGYAGISVSPFASFAASFMQQLLPGTEVSGLKMVNSITRGLLKRSAPLFYLQPSKQEYGMMRGCLCLRMRDFRIQGRTEPLLRREH